MVQTNSDAHTHACTDARTVVETNMSGLLQAGLTKMKQWQVLVTFQKAFEKTWKKEKIPITSIFFFFTVLLPYQRQIQ